MATIVMSSGSQALNPPAAGATGAATFDASAAALPFLAGGVVAGAAGMIKLSLEIDQFLEQLIAGGNDAGAGLKSPLSRDQTREFFCQIHVGHLQRACFQPP